MRFRLIHFIPFLVVLAALPGLLPDYYKLFVAEAMVWSIYSMAYGILLGYAGVLSLGHAMFFGAGAYGMALAIIHLKADPLLALLMAILVSAGVALVTGVFAVRIKPLFSIAITLISGNIFFLLAMNARELTGAEVGLSYTIPPVSVGRAQISLYDPLAIYSTVLLVFMFSFIALAKVSQSSLGKLFQAVRDNEGRVRFLGYKSERIKLTAYVISGVFSGISGALYTMMIKFVSAELFGLYFSAIVIIYSVVGGVFNIIGPLLGTWLLFLLRPYLKGFQLGILLIVIVLVNPSGIVGLAERLSGLVGHKSTKQGKLGQV